MVCRIEPQIKSQIKIVNEDDHKIQFQFCQGKNYCSEKVFVESGEDYQYETDKYDPNPVNCKAWFNGISVDPWDFKVWQMGDQSFRYIVRKNDAIYRSEIDGSKEMVFIKFVFNG
uniref:Uncharacterized protein n=1 Tax=Panagrolaimus sp. JU765 TaxID=591449 RepID=A0AC34RNL4_9BILA